MKIWLVVDVHYMCHRAFHVHGDLSHRGIKTGVIYGFLKSVMGLMEQFGTDRVAFCFEGQGSVRKKTYPEYKAGRNRSPDPEKVLAYAELKRQINDLREIYLPRMGFRNIFCEDGFESDDLMACIAGDIQKTEDRALLVTSDSDMYQCIRSNVAIWNPHKMKMMNLKWFMTEYGIKPWQWVDVKAIAGCKSDNVAGIPGIGEKTVLKYLRKECNRQVRYKLESESARDIYDRNFLLVSLPHEECPSPVLVEDRISADGWRQVCDSLGMKSIAGAYRR